jgi:hypothetical protein
MVECPWQREMLVDPVPEEDARVSGDPAGRV